MVHWAHEPIGSTEQREAKWSRLSSPSDALFNNIFKGFNMKTFNLGWTEIQRRQAELITDSIKQAVSTGAVVCHDQDCAPEPIIQGMFITAGYDPVSEIEGLIKGLKIR